MCNVTLNGLHHLLYPTEISSNEWLTFKNATKQEDKLSFVAATEKDINDHKEGGHWLIIHWDNIKNKALPIEEIWSFKKKPKLDGKLLKHKYWLCAHSIMQQWGDSYWETYSPVTNMLSVRLILAIEKMNNIDSKAINVVLVFPQEYTEEDIWMQLPIGFQVDDQTEAYSKRHYILKPNKNLHGLNQGGYNRYKKLKKYLFDQGYKPSYIDPCLYIGNYLIVLT